MYLTLYPFSSKGSIWLRRKRNGFICRRWDPFFANWIQHLIPGHTVTSGYSLLSKIMQKHLRSNETI